MKNSKSTKKALLASVLSLLLCFTMLIGTTFAWFTDTVTSANNVIMSGNLDIELEYWDGDSWEDVKDQADILTNTLWEPGATEVAYLRVANAGTLALKYKLGINIVSETAGVNVDGEEFLLSDYIMFGVVEDVTVDADDKPATYATREDAVDDLDGSRKISAGYAKSSFMESGDELYLALVVYMPEEVGNIANYKTSEDANDPDKYRPVINLGLKVMATQYTHESDGFAPDYDIDALYADKTYTVEENSELADILGNINAAQDETVLIQANAPMSWETGAGHGSNPWVTEGSAVKTLVIDANGETIKATGAGVGPIRMANGGTLVIKNAKIVDESVSYAEGSWEFGYLEFDGNVVFENVEFVNAIMIEGNNAIFTNCTFNSNKDNEYAAWVSNGNATFTNCTFEGPRAIKIHEAYGSEVGTVIVDSCTFDNITKKPGVAIGDVNADTAVTIKNSDFINCQAGDQGKFIYETDTDVTTFDFDCSLNNEVIKVVAPDLVITTAEELFAFANSVNVDGNGYSGKLVVLGADIDLNGAEWTPIGQTGGNGAATYFRGMFDGKGYTIKNLVITGNEPYDKGGNYATGLFGFVDAGDAQIVNVNVDGAVVKGHHWTGVIAGYISGKISGCTVKNAEVTCTHANGDACGDKAGVIVGYVNSGVVTGNTVQSSTVAAGRDAGQVVGCAKTTQAYGNTAIDVTVSNIGGCTGANIRNEEIGRVN